MKFLIVLNVFAVFILVCGVVVTATNITWGYVGPYDRLLATDRVFKRGSWLRTQTAVVTFPPKGHINYSILSGIKVMDWGGRKNFAHATLGKGGPGHRNATIYLKSQSGKDLNITINYYSR